MAQEKQANTALPKDGDHDRVSMLSLKADGTPDQYDPEIIGDKDFAVESAKRQFAEQAVSAADFANRSAGITGDEVSQDPSIAEAQKEHDKVAAAAEKRASSVIESLSKD